MTYIDLWRKVNTLTEAKKQNKKGKGTKKNNESSVVIVKSKPDHLPVNNKVAKKITEISSQIEDDKEKLDNYLEEIQNAEPTIDIGSFLGFLPVPKKGGVESAIYQVYNSLCKHIVTCGNAIRSANGNISNILELIQLLATAEADIYNLIDNQALASNELRILIKEWCKEHGIHDEEVDKLLESSFQRAYTLRDRLNSLKEELYSELNKNKEDVEKILREIPDYKEKIQQSINEALTIIEGSKDKNIAETDIHFIEKKNETGTHYWVMVNIDGNWYHMDPSPIYIKQYCAFLSTTEDLMKYAQKYRPHLYDYIIEDHPTSATVSPASAEFKDNDYYLSIGGVPVDQEKFGPPVTDNPPNAAHPEQQPAAGQQQGAAQQQGTGQ
jgi:hypothetical protein